MQISRLHHDNFHPDIKIFDLSILSFSLLREEILLSYYKSLIQDTTTWVTTISDLKVPTCAILPLVLRKMDGTTLPRTDDALFSKEIILNIRVIKRRRYYIQLKWQTHVCDKMITSYLIGYAVQTHYVQSALHRNFPTRRLFFVLYLSASLVWTRSSPCCESSIPRSADSFHRQATDMSNPEYANSLNTYRSGHGLSSLSAKHLLDPTHRTIAGSGADKATRTLWNVSVMSPCVSRVIVNHKQVEYFICFISFIAYWRWELHDHRYKGSYCSRHIERVPSIHTMGSHLSMTRYLPTSTCRLNEFIRQHRRTKTIESQF